MEPERDKDVPNKHNPHALSWSNALHHCMCMPACAFEQNVEEWQGGRKKQKVCVSALGVSAVRVGRLRVCGSSLSLSRGTVGL